MNEFKVQNDATNTHELPLVAIVILNWNGVHFLQKMLPSVVASTYLNKKIIVADNASTDNSIAFLQQHYPQIEIIINPTNEGFAKGYNTALQQVLADYYVLLNSDVEVTTNFIEPIIELMIADETIAACQPKILDYNNKHLFEYAGAAGGFIDTYGYPFARGRVMEHIEKDEQQYEDAIPCFWATGAAMFVKATLYHQLGGLDAYFFAHQEEIDFCWRLQNAGYKVYVQPKSVVYHVGGGTLPKGNGKKTYLNFRNNLIMLYKNYSVGKLSYVLPVRFGLDAVAAYKALFSGDTGFYFAVAKAHVHFFKWVVFEKKTAMVKKNNTAILHGMYSGAMLWQYYIKKKKTFSKIINSK